jgi:hypothetical protein
MNVPVQLWLCYNRFLSAAQRDAATSNRVQLEIISREDYEQRNSSEKGEKRGSNVNARLMETPLLRGKT